jgi:hypothetical protein
MEESCVTEIKACPGTTPFFELDGTENVVAKITEEAIALLTSPWPDGACSP